MILGLESGIGGGGEGSGGGRGGDEPTELELKPSDFEEEEEDKEEVDMADQNMEWMTQGPLALLGALHKMLKWLERTITKFKLDNTVKV